MELRAYAERGRLEGYNSGAMILHWAIALAILFQLAVGFSMSRLDLFSAGLRFALFQWHKTVGIGILALTFARIVWRLAHPAPAHPAIPRAERLLAGLVHAAFYALMVLVPLSGWVLVSASPTGIPTLLMLSEHLPWPNLPLPERLAGKPGEALAGTLHIWLAYAFVVLLALHVAGALKHSVIDRAPAFARMLPIGHLPRPSVALLAIPLAAAAVVAFLGSGIFIARSDTPVSADSAALTPAPARSGWTIDKAASELGYSVTFSGKPVTGRVGRWDATVVFDPADLAGASATIRVDTASVTTDDAFIRSNLSGPDGLDVASFPTADIELTAFSKTGTGYLGTGTLRIRSVDAPISVAFTYAETADGAATVSGTADIDRLAYKLGEQNDSKGEWLAPSVKIAFAITARKR